MLAMLSQIGMLPPDRQEIYRYHKLDFEPDGTPVRDDGTNRVFHPILAAYLICDYLNEFLKSKNPEDLAHAKRVGERALAHAETFHSESLVFWYRPEMGLSYVPKRFYSGLTQAWYLKALIRLSRYVPSAADHLAPIFRSLMVPISAGGPLIEKSYGWIVEEHPFEPPLYTLNGWITLLRILIDNKGALSQIEGYQHFLDQNIRAVAHLLPLYDAEFCLNSRYQLAGFTRLRLSLPRRISLDISGFSIEIPGDSKVAGALTPQSNRWSNYLERNEPAIAQFNIVQSLISFPEPNRMSISARVAKDAVAKIAVAASSYDPGRSAMTTSSWRDVGEVAFKAGRANTVEFSLPWDEQNLFAYPTNFAKKLKGSADPTFNTYHFIHIVDLAVLFNESRLPIFRQFMLKWLDYYRRWPGAAWLPKQRYSVEPYNGQKFFDNLRALVGDF
jgi:hypothetical protein